MTLLNRTWFRVGMGLALTALIAASTAYLKRDWFIDRAIRSQLAEGTTHPFSDGPAGFRVLLCGTGSPEPSVAAQACTAVSVGGKTFVFDVGEGATKSLADNKVSLSDIDQVFLTHLHSDHFNGLGTLINQGWTWGRSQPLNVTGPTGTKDVVGALNDAYAIDNGYRAANMSDLAATRSAGQARPAEIEVADGARSAKVYDREGITITAHLVVHDPVKPAFGYVVTYQGKKLFISGDTEVSPLNLDAMRDADVVVHEAYASHLVRRAIPVMRDMGLTHDAQVAERTIPYHANTVALADQAEEAGVKHLVLTHLTPYPDNVVKRHLFTQGMADRFHGELTVGEDGMVITV